MPPLTGIRPSHTHKPADFVTTAQMKKELKTMEATVDALPASARKEFLNELKNAAPKDKMDPEAHKLLQAFIKQHMTADAAPTHRRGGVRTVGSLDDMKKMLASNPDVRDSLLKSAFGADIKRGTSAEVVKITQRDDGDFDVSVKLTNVRTKAVMDKATVTINGAGAISEIRGKPVDNDNTRLNDEIWRRGPGGNGVLPPGSKPPSSDNNSLRPNRSDEHDFSQQDEDIRRNGPIGGFRPRPH